jgi:hypothetical protein
MGFSPHYLVFGNKMTLSIEDEFKFSKSECSNGSFVDYERHVEILALRLKAVHELVQKENKLGKKTPKQFYDHSTKLNPVWEFYFLFLTL